jgi:hypothetical protein
MQARGARAGGTLRLWSEAGVAEATRHLRIHGDNVIECDRTLALIATSLGADVRTVEAPPYRPRFELSARDHRFVVDWLPGYARWGVDLLGHMKTLGGPVREAPDSIITEVLPDARNEQPLLAIEFSSALPAGNNAWQRSGRGLTLATVGIPYLYFAEVGGLELGADRRMKASRLPNPIVPFSFATASITFDSVCLPVYAASPSSPPAIAAEFADTFGLDAARALVRGCLTGDDYGTARTALLEKALAMTWTLAGLRRGQDTLPREQWEALLSAKDGRERLARLTGTPVAWSRRTGSKMQVTDTFARLLSGAQELGSVSIGAGDIPLCACPSAALKNLGQLISDTYGDVAAPLVEWLLSRDGDLLIVWVTGFKPRGDDSRPDRGLLPLARLLFGYEVEILTVVSGPGKQVMWRDLAMDPAAAAAQNGLWEAIFALSDAILCDSVTSSSGPMVFLPARTSSQRPLQVMTPVGSDIPVFAEHDVDTVLHLMISRSEEFGVHEGMCNPPGGDWSGLSIFDPGSAREYRWTSLPRVSGDDTKRPDHVAQFLPTETGHPALLTIESKTRSADLESGIGPRMTRYLTNLLQGPATVLRGPDGVWAYPDPGHLAEEHTILSAGAFCYSTPEQLEHALIRGELDLAIGVEFDDFGVTIHVRALDAAREVVSRFLRLSDKLGRRIEVREH